MSQIPSQNPYIIGALGALAVFVFLLPSAIFTVNETQQALVLQFGEVKQQITKSGLAFKIPLVQETRFFDKRILNVDPPKEEVLLSDQKRLVVDSFARYRITDMLKFFQALGNEQRANDRLQNIINANMRNVLGKVPLSTVLTEKRAELMKEIQIAVNHDADRFGIQVVNVRIVRADLPDQTSNSIYARMKSEREQEATQARAEGAEKAQKIRADADKERRVLIAEAGQKAQMTKGEGDRAATLIYSAAFGRDPEFYAFYRSLAAYKTSLSKPETTLVLTPNNRFFKYFNQRLSTP